MTSRGTDLYAVLVGDVHLRDDGYNSRRRAILDSLVDHYAGEVVERGGIWILLGDLNHGTMRIDDRNFLAALLKRMAEAGDVVIVRGNHDRIGELDVFQRLIGGVYLCYAPEVLRVAFDATSHRAMIGDAGGFRLNVLPYVDRKPSDAPVPEALDTLISGWAADDEPALTVGHLNVAGSVASTGQPQIGREIELSIAHVDLLSKNGPVLLGHIHKPQTVGEAVFVGSICQQDWAEADEQKRVMTFDSTRKVSLHAADVTGHVMLTHDCRHDPIAGLEPELPHPPAAETEGHLRVRVAYNPLEGSIDPPQIAEACRRLGWRQTKVVGIPDDTSGVRCREVAEAPDVPAKVRAWCDAQDVEWTPALAGELDTVLQEASA